MRRDLPDLHYFVRIAEAKSVSRAATALKLSQPALSRYIRALESDIGTQLFERNGRGVTLTESGNRLYARAKVVLDQLEMAEIEVAEKFGPPLTQVTLGIVSSMTDLLVVDIARRMRERLPRVLLRVVEGFTANLIEWLHEGRIDVAVCFHELQHASVEVRPLSEQGLYLLGADGDPMMTPCITFEALSGLPLVLPVKQSLLRTQLEGMAAARGLRLNVVVEADAFETTANLVTSRLCYAIVPQVALQGLNRNKLKISKIIKPDLFQTLVLAGSLLRPQTTTGKILAEIVAAGANASFGTEKIKP